MVQILSRSLAMVFAVALVAASSWALAWSYDGGFFDRAVIIDCVCFTPMLYDDTAGWTTLPAGRFHLRAPPGTGLYREGSDSGSIREFRYALTYRLIDRDDDGVFAKTGSDYSEYAVTVGGKPGVIRSAEFHGRPQPFFLQLVVPRAVKTKDGRWLTLEIHSFLQTTERAWLADRILRTVDFAPPFDVPVEPPRPFVAMPTIEIETP